MLASLPKLFDPARFMLALSTYGLFSDHWRKLLALLVPALELVCGVALARRRSRAAHLWALLLFTGFSSSLAWAIKNRQPLNCGCLGPVTVQLHRLPYGASLHWFFVTLILFGLIWTFCQPVDGAGATPSKSVPAGPGLDTPESVPPESNPGG